MSARGWMNAADAAALLRVNRATLYAYVSRGVLRSYRQGMRRQRLYRRADVDDLRRLVHRQVLLAPDQHHRPRHPSNLPPLRPGVDLAKSIIINNNQSSNGTATSE